MGERWGEMGKKWVKNEITGLQKTALMHASAGPAGGRSGQNTRQHSATRSLLTDPELDSHACAGLCELPDEVAAGRHSVVVLEATRARVGWVDQEATAVLDDHRCV